MIKRLNCQLKQLLYKTTAKFKKHKIKSPELETEILMSFVLKKSREFILTHPEYKFSYYEKKKLNKVIKKRIDNEPIAYIIGQKEFYKIDFYVDKNVLIPRPETELLVENTLNIIKTFKHKNLKANIIDIGTGSGAIIMAIAKNAPNNNFFATDISHKALNVARKNAKKYKLDKKIKFSKSDLLKSIIKNSKYLKNFNNPNNSLIIIANLPYLTKQEFKKEKSIQAEPKIALISKKTGLKHYEQFFRQLKYFQNFTVLIEFNPRQTKKIIKIVKCNIANAKIKIKKDLQGLNRIMIIKCGHTPT